MALHSIAWYCMVLNGIARYCTVLHGVTWYCMVLHGFFLLTRYQSKISGIGVTPPTSSTVQWHTSITAPPLFEVYNGVECWLHHYLLFFVWPCSLARSCRRCCCRSAAREGELQGRWPSRHAALQGLRPALCCVPRNERLAGYLM